MNEASKPHAAVRDDSIRRAIVAPFLEDEREPVDTALSDQWWLVGKENGTKQKGMESQFHFPIVAESRYATGWLKSVGRVHSF